MSQSVRLYGDARTTDTRGTCLLVGVSGAVGGNEVRHRVFRLEREELVKDKSAFLCVDDFAGLVADDLAFQPKPSSERAVSMKWVAAKPAVVVDPVGESHALQPLGTASHPRPVEAPQNTLAPNAGVGLKFGVVEEDGSSRGSVQVQLGGSGTARGGEGRRLRGSEECREGSLEVAPPIAVEDSDAWRERGRVGVWDSGWGC